MAELVLIISEENRALFSSLAAELKSLRQSVRAMGITCCCVEGDCPFKAEDTAAGSLRRCSPELPPPRSPTATLPKAKVRSWSVTPHMHGAADTEQRPRPKSAFPYLFDDIPPYELIKQKQVDSVIQKYTQSIDDESTLQYQLTPTAWESCEEDPDDEENRLNHKVFVRHSRGRTNIRLRRCSSGN